MEQIETLFSSKWLKFQEDISGYKDIEYPGIYMFAYAKENLTGKKVRVEDVFYIGMSNSIGGVEQRIYQFMNSIDGGGGHSAGTRFFIDFCSKKSYYEITHRKSLFFTYVSIPCKVRKGVREAKDLRVMGDVAKLEYLALAHVKELTGSEPELNKK